MIYCRIFAVLGAFFSFSSLSAMIYSSAPIVPGFPLVSEWLVASDDIKRQAEKTLLCAIKNNGLSQEMLPIEFSLLDTDIEDDGDKLNTINVHVQSSEYIAPNIGYLIDISHVDTYESIVSVLAALECKQILRNDWVMQEECIIIINQENILAEGVAEYYLMTLVQLMLVNKGKVFFAAPNHSYTKLFHAIDTDHKYFWLRAALMRFYPKAYYEKNGINKLMIINNSPYFENKKYWIGLGVFVAGCLVFKCI